jgi:predicted Zn-ribbon and HTH transcriptional regulator
MSKVIMTITRWQCGRCKDKKTGHPYQWMPRIEGTPKRCPNCKSKYWNTPRTRKRKK